MVSSRFGRFAREFRCMSLIAAIGVTGTFLVAPTCRQILSETLEGLGEVQTYSIAYMETGSSTLKFSEVSSGSIANTKVLGSPGTPGGFDMSADGTKVAYLDQSNTTKQRIHIYDTASGTLTDTYTANHFTETGGSDIEDMARSALGEPDIHLVGVLGINWTSQSNTLLGVHTQITDPTREGRGAVAFKLDTTTDSEAGQIDALNALTSQRGFLSFDWAPNDQQIAVWELNTGVNLYDVGSSSPIRTFTGKAPQWGQNGVAYRDHGDVYLDMGGNAIRITNTGADEVGVDIARSGGNPSHDVIFWLSNNAVYYMATDGSIFFPPNVPYTNASDPFQAPIGSNIAAFDAATTPY